MTVANSAIRSWAKINTPMVVYVLQPTGAIRKMIGRQSTPFQLAALIWMIFPYCHSVLHQRNQVAEFFGRANESPAFLKE
jgi:hypothetical protein